MRGYWAHPSLSRDFALLSVAVLFVLLLISGWITYSTYEKHTARITQELEKEAARIERTLASEMENANFMLMALGKQFVLDPSRDLTKLALTLKSFDSKGYIYAVLTLVNADEKIVVSSNRGVLDVPVDASDRDYVKKAFTEPWKMHIGRPVEGHVSNRWIIPTAMGLTDYTGKFIGTIVLSIDINKLTERISNLVKRDGISFAILSKTLIALTQVSEDKDFVANNFLTQKLININFTTHPGGLISHGSLFWGSGNYAYYRVSENFPYIVLLGYDTHYSDETVRNILWSRLVQMLAIALFFVLFLWLMRLRMIKPVMEITSIATAVAKGDTKVDLPRGGAIEIEGLALQIRRVAQYIDEMRRVEDELRNKIYTLKTSRDQMEISGRSKSELLASICQEMQVPLNNIIGSSEALKDQLFGPIENRKYKQYAADIHAQGNQLLDNVRDTLVWVKAETDYIDLMEKPVDVSSAINKTLRFMADKMQAEKLNVKVSLQEPLPRLIVDEFRFQQILTNLLLHLFHYVLPDTTLLLEARTASENKDKLFFAITLSTAPQTPYTQSELIDLAQEVMEAQPAYLSVNKRAEMMPEKIDINLELVKTLINLHQGYFDIRQNDNNVTTATIIFSAARIRFRESS